MKEYYKCFDLFPILQKKVLVNISDIGCGQLKLPLINLISQKNISGKFKLYDLISEKDFLSELDLNYSEKDLKSYLPNYTIKFVENAQVKINDADKNQIISIVSTHFIEFDIEDFKSYSKIEDGQDLIHCRFVLHFRKFNRNRLKIIHKLTSKLKKGGFLYLSFYNEISKNREDYSNYKLINLSNIKIIEKYISLFLKVRFYKSTTYNDKMERIHHVLIERI